MSTHLRQAWAGLRHKGAQWTWDVDYSDSKNTLKTGEVVSGTRQVTVEASTEVEARLMAEQMVASTSPQPFFGTEPASGNEPTGVRLVDVIGYIE